MDRGLKVLIVGELATTIHECADVFARLGFTQIEEAYCPKLAFEQIKMGIYDLVMSDWEMHPVSGLELLKMVRSEPLVRHLPFILVTALVQIDRVIEARQANVSAYLVRPFGGELLSQKLSAILGHNP